MTKKFKEYTKLYIVPTYSNEERDILENFLTENKFRYSIPIKPPKSIFDKDFKLKAKEKS